MTMLVAVLVASLLGSVHCAAMCGGFAVATCSGGVRTASGSASRWRPALAYQVGRLLGYLVLGVAAGLVGAGLDLAGGTWLGLQRLAAVLTGSVLVAMALLTLWPRRPGADAAASLVTLGAARTRPGPRGQPGRRWLVDALGRGGSLGAAAVGMGSALLPCGWLWGYVLVAAATGAVLPAMAVMLAFWAGGVPVLLSLGMAAGTVAGWLRRRLGRHAPRLLAAAMLLLGVLALAGKLGPSPMPSSTPCHPTSTP